jgi:hypothetical protein
MPKVPKIEHQSSCFQAMGFYRSLLESGKDKFCTIPLILSDNALFFPQPLAFNSMLYIAF